MKGVSLMENITQRIFRLASERDVKQVDIATACKLSATTVNSWKTRNIIPPSDVIIPICRLLEVSPEFLLAGWTEHYPQDVALPADEAALLPLLGEARASSLQWEITRLNNAIS